MIRKRRSLAATGKPPEGRHWRAIAGVLLILLNVAMIVSDIVVGVRKNTGVELSRDEIILHALFLLAAWGLIHWRSLNEVLKSLPVRFGRRGVEDREEHE